MLCIHSPPVSGSTAKLHENKQALWCCFGLSWKRKIKQWLCFMFCFVFLVKITADCWRKWGKLLWHCDILLPVQTKPWQPIVEKWPVVDREAYGNVQYKNLLTGFSGRWGVGGGVGGWGKGWGCGGQVSKMLFGFVFFVLFIALKSNLSLRNYLPQ